MGLVWWPCPAHTNTIPSAGRYKQDDSLATEVHSTETAMDSGILVLEKHSEDDPRNTHTHTHSGDSEQIFFLRNRGEWTADLTNVLIGFC